LGFGVWRHWTIYGLYCDISIHVYSK
jgi:hypothetical protein